MDTGVGTPLYIGVTSLLSGPDIFVVNLESRVVETVSPSQRLVCTQCRGQEIENRVTVIGPKEVEY